MNTPLISRYSTMPRVNSRKRRDGPSLIWVSPQCRVTNCFIDTNKSNFSTYGRELKNTFLFYDSVNKKDNTSQNDRSKYYSSFSVLNWLHYSIKNDFDLKARYYAVHIILINLICTHIIQLHINNKTYANLFIDKFLQSRTIFKNFI